MPPARRGQRSRSAAPADTRERILDAAAAVMSSHGLARTTTKEIARAAGYSEALLYRHFEGKEEIFLRVLHERLPGLVELAARLPQRAGSGTVESNLAEVAHQALFFYLRSMPIAASVFSTPDLLERHREWLRAAGEGPQRPNEQVAEYLRAEQRLGRIAPTAHPETGAALLLGACFQRAFLANFLGEDTEPGRWSDEFTRAAAHAVLAGLAARPGDAAADG